jgi:hypothetical protein
MLESPSRCLEHLRRVVFAFTLSNASQTRLNCLHTVSSVPDAFYLPSRRLQCLRRVVLVLTPSRASQARCTHPCLECLAGILLAFKTSGVFLSRLSHLHSCLHAVSYVSDMFGSPSRHLERFRRVWYASGVFHMRSVCLYAT